MLNASVVICTYRRPQALVLTLDGLQRQKVDPASFEVIVVDNDPQASASELVTSLAGKFSKLRYAHEPAVGESLARNRGAQEAQGDWIIYLDDDAVPDQTWLPSLIHGIERMSGPGVMGGAILPFWPAEPPKWLSSDLYWALSVCNHAGNREGFPLHFPEQEPYGSNIVYAKEPLLRLGGFNPKFGRQGDILLSGAETELNYRFYRAGYPIWFCPSAVVYHHVPLSRLEKAFFRSRYYWAGRGWALLDCELYGRAHLRKELWRRIVCGIAVDPVRFFHFSILVRRNPFLTEVYYRGLLGYIVQAVRLLRR